MHHRTVKLSQLDELLNLFRYKYKKFLSSSATLTVTITVEYFAESGPSTKLKKKMLTNRRTLAVTLRNKMYVPQTECPRTTRQSWSIQKKVNNVRTNKYNKRIKFLRPPYPPPYPPLTSLKPTFPTFPNTYLSHFNFIKN